jgi:endonuclease/exonuclease/phosphatase family metal-dependent hydrolase
VQILQLASWNVWGKSLFQIADVLSDQGIHFDIIALQEVGGLSQGKLTTDGFLAADDPNVQLHDELRDYWIVATDQLSSHHGQAILVDKTFATAVLHTLKGTRFLGAQILHKSGLRLWVFSGHLPHHHQPLSDYSAATTELRQLLQRTQHLPTLVVGDWNATPHREPMDEQALALACLEAEAQLMFRLPEQPTWKHRVYDFVGFTPAFERCIAPSCLPTSPLIVEGMDSLLPSDHKLITWETTFFQPPQLQGYRHKQHTGRWQVDLQRLQRSLEHQSTTPDWPQLCRLARRCQYRLPSRKFQDSPALKELCRARNATANALQRASLSRHIIVTRRAERAQWLSELHTSASSGDTSAIAFLKAKHQPTANWSHLIAHSGSLQGAIHNVKNHFQEVFSNTPIPTRTADCSHHIEALQAHMDQTEPTPLQPEELSLALANLKLGKTSGASGMSNEFLLAMGSTATGHSMLLNLLNAMLIDGDIPPPLLTGIACLLPKTPGATAASQIRPILLLEVLQKLFASILMRRIHSHWPPLHVQVGRFQVANPLRLCSPPIT